MRAELTQGLGLPVEESPIGLVTFRGGLQAILGKRGARTPRLEEPHRGEGTTMCEGI